MAHIDIGNSYSRITGLTPQQDKGLRAALSYLVGGTAAFYSRYGTLRKSMLSKHGEFPTGLYPRVLKYLGHEPEVVARPQKPSARHRIKLNPEIAPHDWQLLAANKAVLFERGTISACTGSGKSLVIALIAARLNVKTLVVVPTVEICLQLRKNLLDALGAGHKVEVYNIDARALKHRPKEPYECLIIDEAHHAASKTYQKFNKTLWTGIYYRFFLTATPFRNDTEETLLYEAIAGEVIYELDYKTAVSKGYIVPVEAYYIDVPKKSTDAFTWAEVYKELVVNNTHRNEMISTLLHSLEGAGKSTLCLVKEVQHGKNITWPTFVHGQDEESRRYIERFNAGEIKALVATTGILGEGVDTRPCEYVLIAGLGKAKSQFLQQVGRAVRRYPDKESAKIIIFRDRSHKFTLRHFNEQKKILLDYYGIIPVKLDLGD